MRDLPRPRVRELVSMPLQLAHVALLGAAAVWAAPVAGVVVFGWAVMWLAIGSFVLEKRGLPEEDAERYAGLAHARARLLTRFVEWVVLGANATLVSALVLGPEVTVLLTFLAVAGPLVAFLPRLTRVQREMRHIAGTNVPGTDLSKWRAGGLIYWAPDDPAIVVPKRIGIGSTLNFAQPVSWILLGAVCVVPLLVALMVA